MIESDAVKPFLGHHVVIVLNSTTSVKNNFVLDGTIDRIYGESILFTTKQETSLIHLSELKKIKMKHRRSQRKQMKIL